MPKEDNDFQFFYTEIKISEKLIHQIISRRF